MIDLEAVVRAEKASWDNAGVGELLDQVYTPTQEEAAIARAVHRATLEAVEDVSDGHSYLCEANRNSTSNCRCHVEPVKHAIEALDREGGDE